MTPLPPAPWSVTFDDPAKSYTLTDFGLSGAASALVTDPAGGSNLVAHTIKAVGSEQWAGTTASTDPNFSVATVPFTATKTKMTMRIYSPATGVRVRIKVESAGNPGINCETDAFTSVSGAWENLSYDCSDPSTHYIPHGPTTYDRLKPTAMMNVANTYNEVSLFFDFGQGNGGYAPLVADNTYYYDDLAFVS